MIARTAFVSLVGISGLINALSQEHDKIKPRVSQYIHQSWEVKDGLPQNSITSIAQTPDGYLWLGTRLGIVRFDGRRFTTLDKWNTPQLTSNHVWSVLATRDGSLWAGTDGGGVLRIRGDSLRAFTTADRLPSDNVWCLYEDSKGSVWVGTGGAGVCRISGDSVVQFIDHEYGLISNFVWSITEDGEGGIWFGMDEIGLNRLKDGKLDSFRATPSFYPSYVLKSYTDNKGNVWFGAAGAGIIRREGSSFKTFGLEGGLPNLVTWAIEEDEEGGIWVGTEEGLVVYPEGKVSRSLAQHELDGANVSSILYDREGNMWVGTRGKGLHRFRKPIAMSFTSRQGLSKDFVHCVSGGSSGSI